MVLQTYMNTAGEVLVDPVEFMASAVGTLVRLYPLVSVHPGEVVLDRCGYLFLLGT